MPDPLLPGPFYNRASERTFRQLVERVTQGAIAAVLGAGLSAPTHPAWETLHATMLQRAGLNPRRFRPDRATAELASLKKQLGEDEFLAIIKELYGGPIVEPPEVYRLLDEITNLHPLITTNFDENLASVAIQKGRQMEIAAYPRVSIQPRYVYLHGRAREAATTEQLVVCADDYLRAYGQYGQAEKYLEAVLMNSALFVGSSLRDPGLLRVIDENYRSRTLLDSLVTSYAILPAVEDPAYGPLLLGEQVNLETEWLEGKGIEPVLYIRDDDHTQLPVIVNRLRSETRPPPSDPYFLEIAAELDAIAAAEKPDSEQITRVTELLSAVPEYREYFLTRVTAPGWFKPLLEAGILTAVSEPRHHADGRVTMLPWSAARYVGRIARTYPEGVRILTAELRTSQNWHVRNVLSTAALELPASTLRPILPVLLDWLRSEGPLSLLSHNLVSLAESLVAEHRFDLGLRLLTALTEPVQNRGGRESLRAEDHELTRLQPLVSAVIDKDARQTYRALKRNFGKAVSMQNVPARSALWWRPSIAEGYSDEISYRRSLDFLVDNLRDALLGYVDQSEYGVIEVKRLIEGRPAWGRRLGIYATSQRESLSQTLSDVISRPRLLRRIAGYIEFKVALRERFADLSLQARQAIHRLVEQGPTIRDASEQDARRLLTSWRWRLLNAIPPDMRTERERRWYEEIESEHEQPSGTMTKSSAWEATSTPTSELIRAAEQGHSALLTHLRSSREQWVHVEQLVRRDPDEMLTFCRLLREDDFPDAFSYFSAYLSLVKDGVTFAWRPLVELCERLSPDPPADRGGVSWAVSWLLCDGLSNRDFGIPVDLLGRTLAVVIRIIDGLFTPLSRGVERPDLTVHQLNDPAGRAADGLLFYIWRSNVADPRSRHIPDDAASYLQRALDDAWGGVELRHAIGNYVNILEWCEPGWLRAHMDSLWPASGTDEASNARVAFWNGYLWTPQLGAEVMISLTRQYSAVLRAFSGDNNPYLGERQLLERLAEHLVIGWLRDVKGFSFNDLLGEFVQTAPDALRAHAVWFMQRALS